MDMLHSDNKAITVTNLVLVIEYTLNISKLYAKKKDL